MSPLDSYRLVPLPQPVWVAERDSDWRPVASVDGYIDEKFLDETKIDGDWGGNIHTQVARTRGQSRRQARSEGAYALSRAQLFVSPESRQLWKPRLQSIVLNNPYVPLTLRTVIFGLSCAALALACSVFVESRRAEPRAIAQQPSTMMAISVQSTALVYLVYITYDEYSSKPIGLREPRAKMRLIMLDLFFIIFSSANLSLAFNTLYDVTWTCQSSGDMFMPYNASICSRQKALASFLFLGLVMWVTTFTISIFRLVERVVE